MKDFLLYKSWKVELGLSPEEMELMEDYMMWLSFTLVFKQLREHWYTHLISTVATGELLYEKASRILIHGTQLP